MAPDERDGDEHSRVRVAGAEELLLEGRKFVCRGDGSERNYMRSLRSSRDACYCGLRVKIRRDDGNNYPRNQQHSDEFEPAIHGKPGPIIIVQSSPLIVK